MVFMLSKKPRYFYDAEAVKEDGAESSQARAGIPRKIAPKDSLRACGSHDGQSREGVGTVVGYYGGSRNLRNVWTIPTAQFSGSHFAVFPPRLVEICVKAGTSERGVCGSCGAPWERVTETTTVREIAVGLGNNLPKKRARQEMGLCSAKSGLSASNSHNASTPQSPIVKTLGWQPSCSCQELRCVGCNELIEYIHEAKTSDRVSRVQKLRRDIPTMEDGRCVLQSGVLQHEGEHHSFGELRAVRQGNPQEKRSGEVLQQILLSQAHSSEPGGDAGMDDNEQGLQAAAPPGSSECDALWICDGASACDGASNRSPVDEGRGDSSQEREQIGQPTRELGIDDQGSARSRATTNVLRDVPSLPEDISDEGECPHCGCGTRRVTPQPVPATVLDCFAGAGTTGLVAARLNRRAVLIELNPEYVKMAARRIEQDWMGEGERARDRAKRSKATLDDLPLFGSVS
jgi:hypothetical protein